MKFEENSTAEIENNSQLKGVFKAFRRTKTAKKRHSNRIGQKMHRYEFPKPIDKKKIFWQNRETKPFWNKSPKQMEKKEKQKDKKHLTNLLNEHLSRLHEECNAF